MKNDYEIRGDITAIFLKRRNGDVLETLISTSDLPKVKKFPNSWVAKWCKRMGAFYVGGTRTRINGEIQSQASLHRWICDEPKGMVIDHINHNTLDNTRGNLRVVTTAQNLQNKKGPQKNNKTGVRGVCWRADKKRWQAAIGANGKIIHIGTFKDKNLAEKAVIEARKKHLPYCYDNSLQLGE